jgi:hypothetical protein
MEDLMGHIAYRSRLARAATLCLVLLLSTGSIAMAGTLGGPLGDECRNGCATTIAALTAAGGTAKLLLLPEAGLKGNSHMMMMDKNNLQIADMIMGWIGEAVAKN